ncbi:RNA-directed DNA polymerase from transposon BS, partial [Paramuricea clavata]
MCKIGRTISQERVIRCGVPQGSTLGPLLFLLYVNDLPSCLSHSIASMFADDTNLTTSGKSIEDIQNQLNSDLENIHTWLLTNKLTLNKEKTEYMIISSRQRLAKIDDDPKISLDGIDTKRVKQAKTLVDSFSCNFVDFYGCQWSEDANDDFNWIRGSGHKASRKTGPTTDHTRGVGLLANKNQGPGSLQHRGRKCIRVIGDAYNRPKDGQSLVLDQGCWKGQQELQLWPNGTLMLTRHGMCAKPNATGQ